MGVVFETALTRDRLAGVVTKSDEASQLRTEALSSSSSWARLLTPGMFGQCCQQSEKLSRGAHPVVGGAGMIGRKLAERLVRDGSLAGEPISHLSLVDAAEPERAVTAPFDVDTVVADVAEEGVAGDLVSGRPDVVFHLAAVVSGEAEADLEKGYRVNLDGTRYLFDAVRTIGHGYRPRVVFASSIAVFGPPFPEVIGDDQCQTPRTSSGTQKAIAELLLSDYTPRHPRRRRHPPADDLRSAGQAQPGSVGLLLDHHPRAVDRAGGGAAGGRRRTALACVAAGRGRLLLSAAERPQVGDRCDDVGEVVLKVRREIGDGQRRRIAGEEVVRRIRREPDETVMRIVAGWPRNFDARHASALGFRAEANFDEIIRAHVEDELGGRIAVEAS
jgi:nucleoside-diphosphate-sugar epimerase